MLLSFDNNSIKRYVLTPLLSLLLSFMPLSAQETEITNQDTILSEVANTQEEPQKLPVTEIFIDEDEFTNLPPVVIEPQDETDGDQEEIQQQTPQLISQEDKDKVETLLKKIMEGFEKISFSLEHIALVLNHNQIKIKNKDPLVEEVMKLRMLTHGIVASAVTETTPQRMGYLLSLQKQVIDHIRYILTTDLINFSPFEKTAQSLTRSLPSDQKPQTLSELETTLKQNDRLISKLESESISVGLNAFNVLFRRLEKLNDDYKLVNKCLWGLGGFAALGGLMFVLDAHYIKKIGGVFDTALSWAGLQSKAQTIELGTDKKSEPTEYSTSPQQQQGGKQTTYHFHPDQQPHSAYETVPSVSQESPENVGTITKSLMYIKRILGDSIPSLDKITPYDMPVYGKIVGEGTWAQELLHRNLGLVVLGIPPISIFGILQPHLKDAATHCLDWAQNKRSQLASYLRGGPIKKSLSRFERETKATFDDVIGNEHAKMVFTRIKEYFLDPEKFDRGGMAPTNAKLLIGDTRTGKSFFVDAVYGEIMRAFEERGLKNNLLYMGMSVADLKEYGVSNVLMYAQYHAPCLLFIDELDKGRFQNDGDSHALSELQVAMSKLNIDISKKVIIIAATNRPENIDASIRADGRFGEPIPFTLPNIHERTEYLSRELAKRAAVIDEHYIEQLAYETEGSNYDKLKAILMTAFQKAKIKGVTLSYDELNEAVDEQFHQIIFDEKTLPDKELLLVAVHQVGHALMRILLSPSLQLTKVTIRPVCQKIDEVSVFGESLSGAKKPKPAIIDFGAVFTAHKEDALKFETFKDLKSELKISLAGHATEKVLFGGTSYSYHGHDPENAFDLAKRIVFKGLNEKNMPKALKEQKLAEAYELLQTYEQEVIEVLTSYKEEIITLANILFEEKILPSDAFYAILQELKKRKEKEESSADSKTVQLEETTAQDVILDQPIELPDADEPNEEPTKIDIE